MAGQAYLRRDRQKRPNKAQAQIHGELFTVMVKNNFNLATVFPEAIPGPHIAIEWSTSFPFRLQSLSCALSLSSTCPPNTCQIDCKEKLSTCFEYHNNSPNRLQPHNVWLLGYMILNTLNVLASSNCKWPYRRQNIAQATQSCNRPYKKQAIPTSAFFTNHTLHKKVHLCYFSTHNPRNPALLQCLWLL